MENKSYEMAASIIFVQLPEGDRITAFVGLGDGQADKRFEVTLKPVRDIENRRAWLSEALSALLEQV